MAMLGTLTLLKRKASVRRGSMRTKFWYGIGLLASIAAGAGSAGAADLAVKAPPPGLAPAYLSDWAGFYIGINGGGGWAETKFDGADAIFNSKPTGGLFGGHAGYNWQYGSVVAGLEVDFDGADIKQTVLGLESKIDELASARARVGYVLFPSLLAYGTAGAGWGHFRASDALGDNANANEFGWTAGVGLEYKLVDHVLLRAEYLHYDFAKDSLNAKTTVDTVRGGLSWKF
jgi:outer membrane immunogenic protein